MLLAADIEVPTARFAGKRIYRCGTGIALKQARATLDKALADAKVENSGDAAAASTPAKGEKSGYTSTCSQACRSCCRWWWLAAC